jgi:hypothetical protein
MLNVLPIAASEFKRPMIREAENNGEGPVLDLTAGATVRIGVWPHIALGQFVWLTFKGKNANGGDHDLIIWYQPTNARVDEKWIKDGYIEKTLVDSYLIGLGDNTLLDIVFKASMIKSQEESTAQAFEVRTYTVKAIEVIKPTITSIKGTQSGQQIPSGSFTTETSVTLTGLASARQQVDIRDGEISKGKPTANPLTRIWTQTIDNLALAPHSLTARAMYGSGEVSAPWNFTVMEALVIDRQPMILKGLSVKMPEWPTTGEDSIGNTQVRQPTKGLPPYSYASSDSTVASINNEGKVTGNKNGNAFIVVLDSGGQSATYSVSVSNVYILRINEQPMTAREAIEWRQGLADTTHCHNEAIADLQLVYGQPLPLSINTWQCMTTGCGPEPTTHFTIFILSGYVSCYWGHQEFGAWCMQPA